MTLDHHDNKKTNTDDDNKKGFGLRVAIIGAGITGVILALGLERRGVEYVVYERNPSFAELGAGIGFSPNAERALGLIGPEVYAAYKRITPPPSAEPDYFTWVDGVRTNEVVARLLIGVDAFQGGRRSEFLDAWSAMIPRAKVRFGKEILNLKERGSDGMVELVFRDGSVEEADLVIGCDGIRSRVRQVMLGEDNPASRATYTHKFCFRSLIPMSRAQAVLGAERVGRRFMYNGPGAHCITYPVARDTLLNALFVISDNNNDNKASSSSGWTHQKLTAPGKKEEVVQAFREWHPVVRALVDLLPEEDSGRLDKWALFDMFEYPAEKFNVGATCLAGDAAHAAGPHLGSGAGFGVEDALVLASILEAADKRVVELGRDGGLKGKGEGKARRVKICHDALEAYNEARFDRDQWLPGATREAVELFQGTDEEVARDPDTYLPRVTRLYHEIWDMDVGKMVADAVAGFERRVEGV
ncbi:hypothetical protein F5Y17DRAFT_457881 [Xylariaceae sp. FL0594]|nr:hypothetical protein F5Y17DRAFT_457881 [Xylariaceae sp. FL0594]